MHKENAALISFDPVCFGFVLRLFFVNCIFISGTTKIMACRAFAVLVVCGAVVASTTTTADAGCQDHRPPIKDRRFMTVVIDHLIDEVAANMSDPELACIFRNTLPNTLDLSLIHI